MNLLHRAIFFARLGLSNSCDTECKTSTDQTHIEGILGDREIILGQIKRLAISGLQDQRLDEGLHTIFVDSGSQVLSEFSSSKIAGLCSHCAKKQARTSKISHICNGRDVDQDDLALRFGGLCVEPIHQAFSLAQKVAAFWYGRMGQAEVGQVFFEFQGVVIERDGTAYSSKIPHSFGDHPSIIPANATTSPPQSTTSSYRVDLEVCVDRILSQHFAQLVLILHHELFCHVYQNFDEPECWPARNDLFTEGFMNNAAFRALSRSEACISNSELGEVFCEDMSEFVSRISIFNEARETSADGALLRFGTTTFQLLERLLFNIDPMEAVDLAVDIAIAINASDLGAYQRVQVLKTFREIMALLSPEVTPGSTIDTSIERFDPVVECLCQFLEDRDGQEFLSNLNYLLSEVMLDST